jgi:protein-S-isoprenylcysteine O-methyltransferase Ste14
MGTPSETNASSKPGLGRRGEHLVAIQFVLMIGFAAMPPWHPGLSDAAVAAWLPWLRIPVAGAFGIAALALALLGSRHLGKHLTPLPYPVDDSELVQHGVYAIVRHPLYASLLCLGLGWTLYQLSLGHLLVWLIAFAFFDYKAGKEEHWLTERHPEYADYARRVHKFVPWIY